MHILLIDDEEFVRLTLSQALQAEGCRVTTAPNGATGIELLKKVGVDCVISDLRMPGMDGLAVLRWITEHQPDVDVIMLTGHGAVKDAVEAMRIGAWDFLIKDTPFDPSQVQAAITRLTTVRRLRQENLALRLGQQSSGQTGYLPGTSASWTSLMQLVQKLAPSNAPVLIQGETGSGKEVVARALHQLSPRRDAPFLAINCGAISTQLLESELFGHEKGAFTGADTATRGLLAAAEGGTLFLDEIGDMNGAMQSSLLRVLDRGEYRPVGGTRTLTATVRFIGATNRNLQDMVLAGTFRDDLLYRINTVTLPVPPLRERQEDIPRLAEYFLLTCTPHGTPARTLSAEAAACLRAYHWPGNVRELRNVMERIVLVSDPSQTHPITAEDVSPWLVRKISAGHSTPQLTPTTLEEAEKSHILHVYEQATGNKTHTAKTLAIDYKTLLAKLKKYGVE
jgi:DNA-binding NtrC family response regulator